MIHYGRHQVSEEDIQAVVETLKSNFLTQGAKVPEFENALANTCNAKYAVAVTNGTSALHLACLALGLKPGGRLWTSPISFVASANCARYCGADVDFVDIDPLSFNICPTKLSEKLEHAQKQNALPDILAVVHFAGRSCEMKDIYDLAQKYNFKIIEDAAHALGATYEGYATGSCQHSDCTTFSFHPVKSITTGEGGAITTSDEKLFKKIRQLRSHGVEKQIDNFENNPHGGWYYEQQSLGFNYRMSDLQAALGLSQLSRLNIFIEQREAKASTYNQALANLGLTLPTQIETHTSHLNKSAWHLFVVLLPEVLAQKRPALHNWLFEHGVQTQVHYMPIYRHPYYQALGFKEGYCPNAENYYTRCLSLPLYPSLSPNDQDQVINLIKEAVNVFSNERDAK